MSDADWIVKTVTVTSAGDGLQITGENLCARDECDRHFSWGIGHWSVLNPRYDWSGADWGPGSRERFDRMVAFARKDRGES